MIRLFRRTFHRSERYPNSVIEVKDPATGWGYLVADMEGTTLPDKEQEAIFRLLLNSSRLLVAVEDLLETVKAYELEGELDAGEEDEGVVRTLKKIVREITWKTKAPS